MEKAGLTNLLLQSLTMTDRGLVMVVSAILPYLLSTMLDPDFIRFLVVGFTCVITVATSVY